MREQKQALRKRMYEILGSEQGDTLEEESHRVAETMMALPGWGTARSVFAFLSMDHEIDTFAIIGRALSDGKDLGIPRMYDEGLKFHLVDSADGPWDIHPYGIREPKTAFPVADFHDQSLYPLLIVTPGLAFDLSGRRLGHGKGYYDRLFNAICDAVTHSGVAAADGRLMSIGEATAGVVTSVAVCASCQIVDEVPVDSYDIPVDIIVTGRGVEYYTDALP